jgi:CRISPR-associated protein Cmr1
LPIVFQFKDTDITPSDPSQTMLQGAEHDRLASPLILRPLACAGGKAVGIALLLIAPSLPPGGVVLKVGMSSVAVQADLDNKEANQIPPLNSNPNVLQAFLDYLK